MLSMLLFRPSAFSSFASSEAAVRWVTGRPFACSGVPWLLAAPIYALRPAAEAAPSGSW